MNPVDRQRLEDLRFTPEVIARTEEVLRVWGEPERFAKCSYCGKICCHPDLPRRKNRKKLPADLFLKRELNEEDRDDRERKLRVKKLVEMLASKNAKPIDIKSPNSAPPDLPANYDRKAQAVVYLAIQGLFAEGDAAIDELLLHTDDDRYCYTYESPTGNYNKSVGGVCFDILHRMIYCYQDPGRLRYITQDQSRVPLPGAEKGVKAWRQEHRDVPLWKAQIMAIDAQIAFMESVDREKAKPPHRHLERYSAEVFDKARKENIEILKAMKTSISALEEPYQPGTLDQQYGSMFGLPWPTRSFGLR